MLKGIALGLTLASLLVAGCSTSSDDSNTTFSCDSAKSKCPKDGPLDVETCKKAINDPTCGSVFLAALVCLGEHQICSADGTTDVDASASVKECASQVSAASKCGVDGG